MAKIICPYCEKVVELEECHPFSSDAGAYWVCPNGCVRQWDEDEVQDMECEYEDALEEARTESEEEE